MQKNLSTPGRLAMAVVAGFFGICITEFGLLIYGLLAYEIHATDRMIPIFIALGIAVVLLLAGMASAFVSFAATTNFLSNSPYHWLLGPVMAISATFFGLAFALSFTIDQTLVYGEILIEKRVSTLTYLVLAIVSFFIVRKHLKGQQ